MLVADKDPELRWRVLGTVAARAQDQQQHLGQAIARVQKRLNRVRITLVQALQDHE